MIEREKKKKKKRSVCIIKSKRKNNFFSAWPTSRASTRKNNIRNRRTQVVHDRSHGRDQAVGSRTVDNNSLLPMNVAWVIEIGRGNLGLRMHPILAQL